MMPRVRRAGQAGAAAVLSLALVSCVTPSDYVYFGSVRIAPKEGFTVEDKGSGCSGSGAFTDVQRGVAVFVLDENGRPLSKDYLSEGRHNLASGCVFRFGLSRGRSEGPLPERLPRRERYLIRVGERGAIPVEFKELHPRAYQLRIEVVLGG